MPRTVNTYWDDLDRDPSPEGVEFAQGYWGREQRHPDNCHAVQSLAVYFDKWREKHDRHD